MRLAKLLILFFILTAFTIPTPRGFVNDYGDIIDSQWENKIEMLANELKGSGTAEIAVLTVKNIEGGDIIGFSQAVFDSWKIGERGKDNGLLFVISVEDRKMRLQTGYGLEGVLPDGLVGEILDNKALPYFKQGKYGEGIFQTLSTVKSILKGEGKGEIKKKKRKRDLNGAFLISLIIFIIIFRAMMGIRGRRYTHFGGFGGGGFSGGGFGGGGFGGFGGGSSGGGGAGRSW